MSGGWDGLNAAIAEARAQVAAHAADAATAEEGEAYVTRVVTAALAPAFLGHRLLEGSLSIPLPVYGGRNPDYIMRSAPLDPTRSYRLEGMLNGSERVGVGIYRLGRNGAPLVAGYTALDASNCGSDGAFAIEIGPEARGQNALIPPPDARILLIRVLHRDSSVPARLDFQGVPALRGPSLIMGSNDSALGFATHTLRNNITEYMKWVNAARNLPNRLDEAPEELSDTVIGDADTQYFLGGFDLHEGEYLEIRMPAELTGYWSLHAYNYWYEHLVTPGVHDRNAKPEADGSVVIAVGPGVPANALNRIDTVGRLKGAFVCRVVAHTSPVAPPIATLRRM